MIDPFKNRQDSIQWIHAYNLRDGDIVKYKENALNRKNGQFQHKIELLLESTSSIMLKFGLEIHLRDHEITEIMSKLAIFSIKCVLPYI